MYKNIITIRSKEDINDFVRDNPPITKGGEIPPSPEERREHLLLILEQYSQYAFVEETGDIVAAIDKNSDLVVSLPD